MNTMLHRVVGVILFGEEEEKEESEWPMWGNFHGTTCTFCDWSPRNREKQKGKFLNSS